MADAVDKLPLVISYIAAVRRQKELDSTKTAALFPLLVLHDGCCVEHNDDDEALYFRCLVMLPSSSTYGKVGICFIPYFIRNSGRVFTRYTLAPQPYNKDIKH